MTLEDAKRSAQIAAHQATEAASVIQRRVRVPGDEHEEKLALAVANLAIALRQFLEAQR